MFDLEIGSLQGISPWTRQLFDCVIGSPQVSTGLTQTRDAPGTPSKCTVTSPPGVNPASTLITNPME